MHPFYWYRDGDEDSSYEFDCCELAADAAETVVTREELMRAYDLVEQGYTLWFGGDCPVSNGVIIDVAMKSDNRYPHVVSADGIWGEYSEIIAYRLSRSVDKDVAAANRVTNARDAAPLVELDQADTIVAAAIEKRIELCGDDKWDVKFEKICVNSDTGHLSGTGNDLVIVTRKQWGDYVSRKIRVGDKVKTRRGNEVEVLFLTSDNAAVRYNSGAENMLPLGSLTRIPQ